MATIALDAMGGDFGVEVVIPAAIHVVKKSTAGIITDCHIILVGDEKRLRTFAKDQSIDLDKHVEIQHASQVVEMHEDPRLAVRKKKDSSMRVAINMVKDGRAQAIVSAGNTGALMATAKFVLKTIPGIDRPAICTSIPSYGGHTHMLDLGANVDSSAQQLLQFAVMGSVLAEAVDNTHQPKVGLLNIGSEDGKGNAQVKEANTFLKDGPFNYIGYVEGDDIYSDKVDVVVCDGFVGNISLKTMEGVAKMIATMMREEFKKSPLSMIAGLIAMPVLNRFKKRVDPRMYNGASMLGLTGIVIKSHGSADVLSYANAIEVALLEVKKSVPEHIRQRMESLLVMRETQQTVLKNNGLNNGEPEKDQQNKAQLES